MRRTQVRNIWNTVPLLSLDDTNVQLATKGVRDPLQKVQFLDDLAALEARDVQLLPDPKSIQ